jgi:hypothetical protein
MFPKTLSNIKEKKSQPVQSVCGVRPWQEWQSPRELVWQGDETPRYNLHIELDRPYF